MTNKSFIFSAVILLVAITLVALIARRGDPVVVRSNLENLPKEIDGYKSTEDLLAEAVYKELNPDIYLFRRYRQEGRREIDLYLGYYGTARGGGLAITRMLVFLALAGESLKPKK